MYQLRKLLRLSKSGFAITIPRKYLQALELKFGDYVEIKLWKKGVLTVKKHVLNQKS